MKTVTLFSVLFLFFPLLVNGAGPQEKKVQGNMDEWEALQISLKTAKSMVPKDGFVPDEATASAVGEAVAIAQYGREMIAKEEPFRARLYGDVWLVHGTLRPQGGYGGTAVIKIGKKDGRILFLTHQE
jgi:hypothetical protein